MVLDAGDMHGMHAQAACGCNVGWSAAVCSSTLLGPHHPPSPPQSNSNSLQAQVPRRQRQRTHTHQQDRRSPARSSGGSSTNQPHPRRPTRGCAPAASKGLNVGSTTRSLLPWSHAALQGQGYARQQSCTATLLLVRAAPWTFFMYGRRMGAFYRQDDKDRWRCRALISRR